jgi:hypothetical protein
MKRQGFLQKVSSMTVRLASMAATVGAVILISAVMALDKAGPTRSIRWMLLQ